ncbi:MAG TPA: zinc ribbon domain-containing protein [Planctomycetota bacterium]|nr:zinc ribbon domain-containing protein [Planctomycetota bacterium]
MPTYVYETIAADGTAGERFEISQRMSEAALTRHPETGVPVRRVISGGLALDRVGETKVGRTPRSGGSCAPNCGHAH